MERVFFLVLILFSSYGYARNAEVSQFEGRDLSSVRVQNLSGNIRLSVSEKPEARLELRKIAWHKNCLLKAEKTLEVLEISVSEKGPGSFFRKSCEADLLIEVPAKVALSLKNGSGDIEVDGIYGEIEFKLGNGDVKIDSPTPSVKGVAGSGDIEILGEMGSTSLRTGSGDIKIVLKNSLEKGEIDIKTGSGDAEITLPQNMKVLADFKAGIGSVESEFSSDSNSEFRVSMRAGSGDLKILKRK